MLGQHRLVIDQWAEVYDLLRPYADEEFWQFSQVEFDPAALYVIGRVQLKDNWYKVCDLANRYPGRIVFCNPAEGSQTILLQLRRLRIADLVQAGKILLLTSGDLESGWPSLHTDGYFSNIVEYDENKAAAARWAEVYVTEAKPFDFLFLNGRLRPHRKYLIHRLRQQGLLDRALWTCLQTQVDMLWSSDLRLLAEGQDVMSVPESIRLLPEVYEIERAQRNLHSALPDRDVKHFLFNNTWGDAIVNPRAYIDSYFSVVTETIYDYNHSFRTEKIWKPMIMCHPWIAVANQGYYRDLRRAGFRTFHSLIDESFDDILDPTDRMERIIATIAHIIHNGAQAFLAAAQDICKYNQQHLVEHNRHERHILPGRLLEYIERHGRS